MFFYALKRWRSGKKILNRETINPNLIKADYAVRGDIALRSMEIEAELRQGKKFPFKEITQCNIGNPQNLGQKPLTWMRQGLALAAYPELIGHTHFPSDITQRVTNLLARVKGGVGAYSESQGLLVVRETVARFIEERDNIGKVLPKDVFLSNGASPAINALFTTSVIGPEDGILTPIPQYPLYNALVSLHRGTSIGYYLEESGNKWIMNVSAMEKAIQSSNAKGIKAKILVVINPGNPTGQVLSYKSMQEILEFCMKNDLVLFADEVYQDNVYSPDKKFYSFRKVALEMGADVEIASFNTISKGFYGECGIRGGYVELTNFDEFVREQILKMVSIMISSNSLGQIALALALNPPKPGDASYQLYDREKTAIITSLAEKAKMVELRMNEMKNISCCDVEGAMYAYPAVIFTENAKKQAAGKGMSPEKMYALEMLEETGIAIVPGCGFGQKENTHHFRITTLPQAFEGVLEKISIFNEKFHIKYQDL